MSQTTTLSELNLEYACCTTHVRPDKHSVVLPRETNISFRCTFLSSFQESTYLKKTSQTAAAKPNFSVSSLTEFFFL